MQLLFSSLANSIRYELAEGVFNSHDNDVLHMNTSLDKIRSDNHRTNLCFIDSMCSVRNIRLG